MLVLAICTSIIITRKKAVQNAETDENDKNDKNEKKDVYLEINLTQVS